MDEFTSHPPFDVARIRWQVVFVSQAQKPEEGLNVHLRSIEKISLNYLCRDKSTEKQSKNVGTVHSPSSYNCLSL